MKWTSAVIAGQVFTTSCLMAQMAGMATQPSTAALPVVKPSHITFTKDVAPILQQNCQSCHRPGEGAPFSMLTYEDARPWAAAMKQMVVTRAMPPWFEDGHKSTPSPPGWTQAHPRATRKTCRPRRTS
jgi:hypothetical protein